MKAILIDGPSHLHEFEINCPAGHEPPWQLFLPVPRYYGIMQQDPYLANMGPFETAEYRLHPARPASRAIYIYQGGEK